MRGKLQAVPCGVLCERITPACAGKTRPPPLAHLTRKDHPRVCGENLKREKTVDLTRGSPPRVRGKQGGKRIRKAEERITPACAGKTIRASLPNCFQKDHPRVCGENLLKLLPVNLDKGSPPRVRGKRIFRHVDLLADRITPACAGKTRDSDNQQDRAEDHPRVCGENSKYLVALIRAQGSPPRVRGKRITIENRGIRKRITPACAGKTPFRMAF